MRLSYRRLPTRERIADQLVTACFLTMDLLIQEQQGVIQELGQTVSDREAMMEHLAQGCYLRSGLIHFSRHLLHMVMDEGDLTDLFLSWMRQVPRAQILEQCIHILKKRPEVPYAPDPNQVSEVPADERRARGGTARLRTRRDPRRTGRCDERPMSTDGVPA
jgi:hypothetical protein